jgi:hypothetical protein
LLLVLVCLGRFASPVRAAPSISDDRADLVDVLTGQPALHAAGALDLRLSLELNFDAGLVGRPSSLAPDVWWRVLPRWSIGVVHSDASLDSPETTASFCVRESDESLCDRRYRGSGLDVMYRALDGNLAISPRLRLLLRDIDPWKPAVTFGAALRWLHDRFSITSDPFVRVPLANAANGNRAALDVPVWFAVEPATGWQLALFTGYGADLVVLRDDGRIPIMFETAVRIAPAVALGAEAGWPELFGLQHDARHGTLMIMTDWRP